MNRIDHGEPLRPRVTRMLLPARLAVVGLWRRRGQFAMVFVTLVTAYWAALQILAVITSVERQVASDLSRVGTELINVHVDPSAPPLRWLARPLTLEDCERLAAMVSGTFAPVNLSQTVVEAAGDAGGASPAVSSHAGDRDVPSRSDETVVLLGTTEDWVEVVSPELVAGRFFRSGETGACVLDEWVHRRLFPAHPPSRVEDGGIEVLVTLAGQRQAFRVIGVVRDPFGIRERFEEWDVTGSARSQIVRFMEYKSVYVPREALGAGSTVPGAVIRPGVGVDPIVGARRILEDLEERGIAAVAWSRKRWAGDILDATSTLGSISNFIWIVVLAITACMVVTVIFVVVQERYREIAIRRVEGAGRGQIAAQLVLENLVLSLLASAAGLVLTRFSSAWMEERLFSWSVSVLPGDALLVATTGALMIILTTALPARRAASLDPVAVLHGH